MKRGRRKETVKNNAEIVKKQNENSIIPLDIIIEILAKLPPRSLAKFICVSKLWYSTICGKHFIDFFMARSLKRLLFVLRVGERRFLYSSTSHEVMSCLENDQDIICAGAALNQCYRICAPVRGLICCRDSFKVVICNPSTSQVVALPNNKTRRNRISIFFGYDSVEDVYKVFCTTVLYSNCNRRSVLSEEHQVFTLGVEQKTWRMIKCQVPHYPITNGLCMNGIFYYGTWENNDFKRLLIVCFNVRLEEFSLLEEPQDIELRTRDTDHLVYYHENIALVIELQSNSGKVNLWVLKDVEKQEWSKVCIVVPSWKDLAGSDNFRCMGTISTGELIFGKTNTYPPSDSFAMIYYDLKEDKARRVEIKGVAENFEYSTVSLDYVKSPLFLSK